MCIAVLSMILESAAICAVTWTLWKYFRQVFVKNHLDNIPGPPCPSWITGECNSIRTLYCILRRSGLWIMLDAHSLPLPGNLPQLVNRQGMPFYRDLIENYEPVVRLQGAHGVSDPPSPIQRSGIHPQTL